MIGAMRPGRWFMRGVVLAAATRFTWMDVAQIVLDDLYGVIVLIVFALPFVIASVRLGHARTAAGTWTNTAVSALIWFAMLAIPYDIFG